MTGAGTGPLVYAVGFVAVVGFDKMFNVYIQTGVSSPTAWGLYRRIPERAVSGR